MSEVLRAKRLGNDDILSSKITLRMYKKNDRIKTKD
jgi:hypothetical protein